MTAESRYEACRKFCQMVGSPVMELERWLLVSELVDLARPQTSVNLYEARNSA